MWSQTRECFKALFFLIFIDDIVKDLVTGNCDPVRIGDLSVNCLLYADDIVLLLESKSGLQSSLTTSKCRKIESFNF
jgi:hypothetical protein